MRHVKIRRLLAGPPLLVVLVSAVALEARQALPDGAVADRVVIEKGARTLSLFSGARTLKVYRIALPKSASAPGDSVSHRAARS
jgi:predicted dithiol-disulfide oxidoreductase (DUF899 family)